jgi:Orsellinic acid/F9775 biosynthesis cluster protein D
MSMSTAKGKISHPEPAQLLQYLPLYKVVICATCKYAIQPQAIARHLKEIHHIHRGHRRPFMQYISALSLSAPQDILKCKIREFPVPLLPVQDGLVCEGEGCGHLCVSTKRMRTHWLELHGRSGQVFLDWQPVKIQTFFRGNLLRYFTGPKLNPLEGKRDPHCDQKNNAEYTNGKVFCPSLVASNDFSDKFIRVVVKFTIYSSRLSANRRAIRQLTNPTPTSSPTTSTQQVSAFQPLPHPTSGNVAFPTSQVSTPSSCMALLRSRPSTFRNSRQTPNPLFLL